MQGIYKYIPETNHVSRAYSFAAILYLQFMIHITLFPMLHVLYFYVSTFRRMCDSLWAGQSADRIPVRARFSAPVQTGPGAHPAFCTMGTGSLSRGQSGRGVALTNHPHLALRLKKE